MAHTANTQPVTTPAIPNTDDRRVIMYALVVLATSGKIPTGTLTTAHANVLRHRVLGTRTLEATAAMMGTGWTREDVRRHEIDALRTLRSTFDAWIDQTREAASAEPCDHRTTVTRYTHGEVCDGCGHYWGD